ncbi:enoyl-CoA hydratase/isomerase family protein [Alteribacillus sp. HJP-4]|uniref:enoyl-CoA hydratase/isomerase family protein n=1 Tax=Alteribacillus sp. HJP-4 TaxID=2775394 RepID=UPI0035CCC9DE
MKNQLVTAEKENGVAVITISNPPLNVMNKQVQKELAEISFDLRRDREVICVILTGAGEKAFIAGADIKEFPQLMGNPEMKKEIMKTHEMLNDFASLPKPTIAVLNGMTFGGGCELALACDMRIAEEHAEIGLPEVKLGLFPGGGGTQRLPRLIGPAKAKEMMFGGEPVDAEEAERIGLVNKVVPKGEGMEMAIQAASHITSQSLEALSRIKKSVDDGLQLPLDEGIKQEMDLFVEVFQTEDIQEGVQAFFEKRNPSFKHN